MYKNEFEQFGFGKCVSEKIFAKGNYYCSVKLVDILEDGLGTVICADVMSIKKGSRMLVYYVDSQGAIQEIRGKKSIESFKYLFEAYRPYGGPLQHYYLQENKMERESFNPNTGEYCLAAKKMVKRSVSDEMCCEDKTFYDLKLF